MLHYLQEAFWARPDHGLRMPWNAVAVMLAFGFGFRDSRFWIAGGIIEILYLVAMATSRRFRARIDSSRSQQEDPSSDDAMFHSLGTPARLRYKMLDEKCRSIEAIYDSSEETELIHENNRDALRRLRTLYLRLLVARRNLMLLGSTDEETRLRAQIAELERELAIEDEDEDIQQSREETLVALEERLGNFERRDASLCSIDTDLTHIDARVDLALQNASLDATPTAISTNIRLTSETLQGERSAEANGEPR
jgi:hypothetical protein